MLGTRDQLLHHLFAPTALEGDDRLFTSVEACGRGCAGAIEQYCDRSFTYAAGRQETFSAEALHIAVRSAPIASLGTVEIRRAGQSDWSALTDTLAQVDESSGVIYFRQLPGDYLDRVRVTYDGGFWIDPAPARDGVAPAGQTKLPDDVFLAWVQLAQDVWTKRTHKLLSTPESNLSIPVSEFPPLVRDMLAQYRRLVA